MNILTGALSICSQNAAQSTYLQKQSNLSLNESEKPFIPISTLSDHYFSALYALGIANLDGILYPEFTQKSLPPLNESEKKRIREFLIQEIEINGMCDSGKLDLGLRVSPEQILKVIKSQSQNCKTKKDLDEDLEIELVGSAVFYFLGIEYIERAFREIFGAQLASQLPIHALLQKYAQIIQNEPNDYDIRSWTRRSTREAGERIIHFLAGKIPTNTWTANKRKWTEILCKKFPEQANKFADLTRYEAIKQLAFTKYKTVDRDLTKYHIAALSDRNTKKLEFIISYSLKRFCTNAGNSLRISVQKLFSEENVEVVPKSNFGNGMQALSDQISGLITPPQIVSETANLQMSFTTDFSKIDEADWPLLMIGCAKGNICRLPNVEKVFYEIFFQKINSLPNKKEIDFSENIGQILVDCLKSHLRTPIQALVLAFKVCDSIQRYHSKELFGSVDVSKICQKMQPYFPKPNHSQVNPAALLAAALADKRIPFGIIKAILELAGFIQLNSIDSTNVLLTKSNGEPALEFHLQEGKFILDFTPEESISKIIQYFESEALNKAKDSPLIILEKLFYSLLAPTPVFNGETKLSSFISHLKFNFVSLNQLSKNCISHPLPFLSTLGEFLELAIQGFVDISSKETFISNILPRLPVLLLSLKDDNIKNAFLVSIELILQNPPYLFTDQKFFNFIRNAAKKQGVKQDELSSIWILSLASTKHSKLQEIAYKTWKQLNLKDASLSITLMREFLSNNQLDIAFHLFQRNQKANLYTLSNELQALLMLCDFIRKSPVEAFDMIKHTDAVSKRMHSIILRIKDSSSFSLKDIKAPEKDQTLAWVIQYFNQQKDFETSYEILKIASYKKLIADHRILSTAWLMLSQSHPQFRVLWKEAFDLDLWKHCQDNHEYFQFVLKCLQTSHSFEFSQDIWNSLAWEKIPNEFKYLFESLFHKHLFASIEQVKSDVVLHEIEKGKGRYLPFEIRLSLQLTIFEQRLSKEEYKDAWALIQKIQRIENEKISNFIIPILKKYITTLQEKSNLLFKKNLLFVSQVLGDALIANYVDEIASELGYCIMAYLNEIYFTNESSLYPEGQMLLKIAFDYFYSFNQRRLASSQHLQVLKCLNKELNQLSLQKNFKKKLAECSTMLLEYCPSDEDASEACELIVRFDFHKIIPLKSSTIALRLLKKIKVNLSLLPKDPNKIENASKSFVFASKADWFSDSEELQLANEICVLLANHYLSHSQYDKIVFWIKIGLCKYQVINNPIVLVFFEYIEKLKNEQKYADLISSFRQLIGALDKESVNDNRQLLLDLISIVIKDNKFDICLELLECIYALNQEHSFLEPFVYFAELSVRHLSDCIEEKNLKAILKIISCYQLKKTNLCMPPLKAIFDSNLLEPSIKQMAYNFLQSLALPSNPVQLKESALCYLSALQYLGNNCPNTFLEYIDEEKLDQIFGVDNCLPFLKQALSLIFIKSSTILETEKNKPKQSDMATKLFILRKRSAAYLDNETERLNIDDALINLFRTIDLAESYIQACDLINSLLDAYNQASLLFKMQFEKIFQNLMHSFLRSKKVDNFIRLGILVPLIRKAKSLVSPISLLLFVPLALENKSIVLEMSSYLLDALNRPNLSDNDLKIIEQAKGDIEQLILSLIVEERIVKHTLAKKILNHEKILSFIGKEKWGELWGNIIFYNLDRGLAEAEICVAIKCQGHDDDDNDDEEIWSSSLQGIELFNHYYLQINVNKNTRERLLKRSLETYLNMLFYKTDTFFMLVNTFLNDCLEKIAKGSPTLKETAFEVLFLFIDKFQDIIDSNPTSQFSLHSDTEKRLLEFIDEKLWQLCETQYQFEKCIKTIFPHCFQQIFVFGSIQERTATNLLKYGSDEQIFKQFPQEFMLLYLTLSMRYYTRKRNQNGNIDVNFVNNRAASFGENINKHINLHERSYWIKFFFETLVSASSEEKILNALAWFYKGFLEWESALTPTHAFNIIVKAINSMKFLTRIDSIIHHSDEISKVVHNMHTELANHPLGKSKNFASQCVISLTNSILEMLSSINIILNPNSENWQTATDSYTHLCVYFYALLKSGKEVFQKNNFKNLEKFSKTFKEFDEKTVFYFNGEKKRSVIPSDVDLFQCYLGFVESYVDKISELIRIVALKKVKNENEFDFSSNIIHLFDINTSLTTQQCESLKSCLNKCIQKLGKASKSGHTQAQNILKSFLK